jgi:hypothetical protein
VSSINAATREEWQSLLRARWRLLPSTRICYCAAHCQEGPYHEPACCRGWCACFCHLEER